MFLDAQMTTAKKLVDDDELVHNSMVSRESLETSDSYETGNSHESRNPRESGNSRESDTTRSRSTSHGSRCGTFLSDIEIPMGSTTFTNMEELRRAQKSLRDLPYTVTSEIMRSMDTDQGWESLAAAAGFTMEDIMNLKGKESPTQKLLWDLGCQSYKVHDLFEKLEQAKRIYEMNILKEYILKGGHERKYTISSYSSAQSESNSLRSLISQLEISVPPSMTPLSSGYSSSNANGSEVNFDYPCNRGKTKSQVGGAKVYDDKVIPGANQSSSMSSSVTKPYQESAALADILRRHALSTAVVPGRHHQPFGSGGTDFTLSSSPSFMCSSVPASNSSDAAQRLINQFTDETKSQKASPPPPTPCEREPDEDPTICMKAAFTYNEISMATHNFSDENYLGHGAFGTVYLGCVRGQQCAVKRLNEASNEQSGRSNQIKKELAALLKYQHKNIVTLYGYVIDGPHVCLVYEYLKNGSLEDRIHLKNNTMPLPWERRLNILVGACQGLHFLHTIGEQPLIHGDIKSANILLDGYLEVKICDLGQARYASSGGSSLSSQTHITIAESSSKLFGTRAYQAQEILNNSTISIKSDVYSMGVVILEVCSGLLAYDQNRHENKFLVSLFKNQIKERNENEWVVEFRDVNAPVKVPGVFLKLLKLADRCVKDTKKTRPDSAKLLAEVEKLYIEEYSLSRCLDATETEDFCDSVSSSVCANTDFSCSTNYQRHLSEASDDTSFSRPSIMLQGRPMSPSIYVQLQDEKMNRFTCHNSDVCEQRPLPLPSAVHIEETQPVVSSLSESLQSCLHSEPLVLQKLYDEHPGKRIDEISVPTFGETPNGEESTSLITPEDYVHQSDPKKMATLLQYDIKNFTPSRENDSSSMLPVTEEKIQYLTQLEDTYTKPYPTQGTFHTPAGPPVHQPRTHPESTVPHQWSPDMHSSCRNIASLWLSGNSPQEGEGAKEMSISNHTTNNVENVHQASAPRAQSVDGKDTDFQNRMIRKRDNLLYSYMKAVSNDG